MLPLQQFPRSALGHRIARARALLLIALRRIPVAQREEALREALERWARADGVPEWLLTERRQRRSTTQERVGVAARFLDRNEAITAIAEELEALEDPSAAGIVLTALQRHARHA